MSDCKLHFLLAPFFQTALLLFLVLGVTTGCADPDPAAKLRAGFTELEDAADQLIQTLESIVDEETARDAIEKVKNYRRIMREAGHVVANNEDVQSRNAVALKNQIREFRTEHKEVYREQLRRLSKIPGVTDILIPVLQAAGEEADMPVGPPKD
ncbi:MAG: hypothetical protein AAFN77_05490 [Planctomycetota bacterium]